MRRRRGFWISRDDDGTPMSWASKPRKYRDLDDGYEYYGLGKELEVDYCEIFNIDITKLIEPGEVKSVVLRIEVVL